MATEYIIYLHGFNSSPLSKKAQSSSHFCASHYPKLELVIPKLPPEPNAAIALVHQIVSEKGLSGLRGFIGSSLGGYYSIFLARHYRKKAVLINPAVRPYELLTDYLGLNENFHTGEQYVVTEDHMEELRQFDITDFPNQEELFLLTQTGDETLDFAEAVLKFPHAKLWIFAGGSHEYENFEPMLPAIFSFLLV